MQYQTPQQTTSQTSIFRRTPTHAHPSLCLSTKPIHQNIFQQRRHLHSLSSLARAPKPRITEKPAAAPNFPLSLPLLLLLKPHLQQMRRVRTNEQAAALSPHTRPASFSRIGRRSSLNAHARQLLSPLSSCRARAASSFYVFLGAGEREMHACNARVDGGRERVLDECI